MTRRLAGLAAFVVCCLAPAAASQAALLPPLFGDHRPQPALAFSYHGWRVDASRARTVQSPAKTVRAIEAQIDIVEHLGLAPPALGVMRTVPIIVGPGPGADPGQYVRGVGVLLHAKALEPKRPLLLRQLLYAYQDRALPGGLDNVDVARLRQEAAAMRVWPNTAAMLRSDPDYFAMTASAYLYGATTREPYTRANLRKTQPDAYQWLADLFDGGRPRA